jgi:hypothetical protein
MSMILFNSSHKWSMKKSMMSIINKCT